MTMRNLDPILHPASVAVVGAGRVGTLVLEHLVAGGFEGQVHVVDPRGRAVPGRPTLARIAALPEVPDLAVVALPAGDVPEAIAALGARGCRLAVVVGAPEAGAEPLRQAVLDAARPHLLRVIGPDALGLVVPEAKLNASLAPGPPGEGQLGLVSQSGAMATVLLDWAAEHGIGFSRVITLGGAADVDSADCLDLLAGDPRTRAILLHAESFPPARKFLSAARAASRLKPVIALKAGRTPAAARLAESLTGALSGSDAVVDAAMRRAGILRVRGLSELLGAAETVGRLRPMERARLALLTNSGAAAVLALDRLAEGEGALAELAPATVEALGAEGTNPVDLGADATPERYLEAVTLVAADAGVDAILVMHCPTAWAAPLAAARALGEEAARGQVGGKPVLACWMGGAEAREARALLRAKGVASYASPSLAAAAVGHLTDWGRAQAALLHVPDRMTEIALGADPAEGRPRAAAVFARAAGEGREVLTPPEVQAVLAAYGIEMPELRIARTPVEAGDVASDMLRDGGGRLAVKLLSRDIPHKSEVGGVVLDVATPSEAEAAAEGIEARLRQVAPKAALDGFALQPMVRRPGAREVILGVALDPVFGPAIRFGAGGQSVELVRDAEIALPPLDAGLAADLVARTRIGRLLGGEGGLPVADLGALQAALVTISHLVEDFPCLRTLDVNPMLVDEAGVVALDAHVAFDMADVEMPAPNPYLAIRPYPGAWRRQLEREEGVYEIRPIRPGDALLYRDFLEHVSAEDIRMRFLAPRRQFPDELGLRLTQLDYDREVGFVALTPEGAMAGISRFAAEPDHRVGEYALLVRSDLKGRGIGTALMEILIDYARADGLEQLEGVILGENRPMQGLVDRLGFAIELDPEDSTTVVSRLRLRGPLATRAAAT